jgi:nicotinic acid mononucleotide adenylyltransferase
VAVGRCVDRSLSLFLFCVQQNDVEDKTLHRPGYTDTLKRHHKTKAKTGLFYFVPIETADVSSTAIRNRLALGQDVSDLTGSKVARYLYDHHLDALFKK